MEPLKTTERNRVQFYSEQPSRTHQSMKDECDINRIMLKWQKTGVIEHANTYEGSYGDFSAITGDYHEHMNIVLAANEMFETLPSTVRKKFQNDPGQFLDFVSDDSNREEMISLGLLDAPLDTSELFEDPTPPKRSKRSQEAAPETPTE